MESDSATLPAQSTGTQSAAPTKPPLVLWVMLWACLLLGVAANSVLAWQTAQLDQSMAPAGLPGCGAAGFDCNRVLASPYARLGGFSLTTFAFGYYAVLAGLLLLIRRVELDAFWPPLAILLPVFAVLGLVTASWSMAVMLGEIGELCLWCVGVHAANLVFFLLAAGYAQTAWKLREREREEQKLGPLGSKFVVAAVVTALMMGGMQVGLLANFHDPAELTVKTWDESPMEILPLDVEDEPRPILWTSEGNRDSENVVVMFGCFTCPYCKHVHGTLNELLAEHPGQFRVDLRMNPLWPDCNKHFASYKPPTKHRYACDAAKAALAVAKVDPAAYPDFADWLFEHQNDLSAYSIAQEARRRVDAEKFDAALESKEVNDRLARDMQLADAVELETVPQVYLGSGQLEGIITRLKLEKVLAEEFGWNGSDTQQK